MPKYLCSHKALEQEGAEKHGRSTSTLCEGECSRIRPGFMTEAFMASDKINRKNGCFSP